MKNHYSIFLLLLCCTSFNNFVNSQINLQTDSTYVYREDGSKQWYYIQKDVYCFLNTGGTQYVGSTSTCVNMMGYWSNATSKFNEVCFNSNSSITDRENQITQFQSTSDYEVSAYALSTDPNVSNTTEEYIKTDDILLITFHDPNLDIATINNFMAEYNLELVHSPNPTLSNQVSWTYLFRIVPVKGDEITSIKLAQLIYENEPSLVKLSEPNMYGSEALACLPTDEVGLIVGTTKGTWYIDNDGTTVWGGISGLVDADADICDCWGEGYTGSGVKVGLIDFGGIEFNHPDLQGSNVNNAYNANTATYESSDFYVNSLDGHGMQVTGIVGATPNNTSLGQRYAVGSAYGAEVIPFINTSFDGGTNTALVNAEIVVSLQEAVVSDVDVISMSFRTIDGIGSIQIQIDNATTVGRPDVSAPGGAWGIVCLAAVGNTDISSSHFPANLPNVIGVGWTNPEDYRSSYNAPGTGGGWSLNVGDGSTYGPPSYNYDVVAPGELMMTTDISTTLGLYANKSGSSFSSPLVASIAAMILEKNPNLTFTQVRDLIRSGAEKVHNSYYDYNTYGSFPGYNDEMFYGRVSCINSINDTPLGVEEYAKDVELTVLRVDQDNYTIYIPKSDLNSYYEIVDMSGRVVNSSKISNELNQVNVNLNKFSSGMYIFRLYNSIKSVASSKLIK